MSIYYLHAPSLGLTKIGYAKNVGARVGDIRVSCPVEISCVGVEEGSQADERARHRQFADLRVRGEWFRHEGALVDLVDTLPALIVPSRGSGQGKYGIKIDELAIAVGISKTHAASILSGKQMGSWALAIHAYRKTGVKVPRLADLSDETIDTVEKMYPWPSAQFSSSGRRKAR